MRSRPFGVDDQSDQCEAECVEPESKGLAFGGTGSHRGAIKAGLALFEGQSDYINLILPDQATVFTGHHDNSRPRNSVSALWPVAIAVFAWVLDADEHIAAIW